MPSAIYPLTGLMFLSYGFLMYKFYSLKAHHSPVAPRNQKNMLPLLPDLDEDFYIKMSGEERLLMEKINRPCWWKFYFNWSEDEKPLCDTSMFHLYKAAAARY